MSAWMRKRRLKEKGKQKGLLVMGPDCGVAFVGGVCLGAGSIMQEGPVGIAAASGSGARKWHVCWNNADWGFLH